MLISAAVSLLYKEAAASSLLYSALITLVTGSIVFTPLRNEEKMYGNREGYIIMTGIWLILSLFGTLPFLISGSVSSFSDAFFESMSGFTTTGATILTDLESIPRGILFWRSLTQWLGGIGIIFISLSILPVVRTINVHIPVTDFSGQTTDKIHPRIKEAAKRLITIYAILTFTEVILLLLGGVPAFDAVCHSFSTLSTGGFSTHNDGISVISSPYIKVVLTLFMFIAGTNLTIYYYVFKRNFKKLIENNELIFYFFTCLFFIIVMTSILYSTQGNSFGKTLLNGSFQVVSVITTTGFYTENYILWGNLPVIILFFLMFTGGTSGSASGSIKIVRLLIVTKNYRQELKRMIHPDAFLPVRLDHKIVPHNTVYNLLLFIAIYFLIFCASSFLVSFMGYDIITSFSTSASMLGNIGPGLGSFGPFTNYSEIPVAGKWLFSILMLLGRLELITVIILFTRNFYRS